MFRLPCALLDSDVVEDYCVDDQLSDWTAAEFIVLDFTCEDHTGEPDFDYDAEAWLLAIVAALLHRGGKPNTWERAHHGRTAHRVRSTVDPPDPEVCEFARC
ncbi:hypothetical protein ABN028_16185 [Actinopolymorpha sp. B17G11]|uniref:hypothetical protein n=1 Tax=unclassified Actinopolymorpha TaxID=2627063 RepID=UPI0032D97E17